ncbi:MAG: aldo/keto reductase [Selenomonas massiliensis]
MEYKELVNGVRVPMLGIGTFQISPADTERAVYTALRDGYRLIDTANAYLNEAAVGRAMARAIAEGVVRREEIFLSTKIWPTLYTSETAVDETLERLGTDYIDLLFIHQPAGDFVAGYRAIEAAYRCGKARSLGISNFHGEKLEHLLAAAEVKPHVIQLETHPACIQHTVLERLAPYGTAVMGWYPLGHGDPSLLGAPVFTRLSDKYRKSTVQIVLRWAVQMGFITIPGTKNPEHIRANFDLFDFALTAEEMAEIARLDGTRRYYIPDTATEERYAAMPLSFEK